MNYDGMISVLMPVYNSGKYLEEAIKSILNQTYENFELIISYDESSDNSLEIIKKYESLDSRIIVSYGKGRGIIKALNDGLKLAKGQYLARMDSDDVSHKTRFDSQIKFMETNPEIGICGTFIKIFGKSLNDYILKYPISDKLLKLKLLFSVSFAHPTVLIRHELLKKHDIKYDENYELIEDYKLWVDMSNYTKFGMVPEVLLDYRHLETSLSKTAEKEIETRYIAHKKVFTEVLKKLNIKNNEKENRLHFIIGLNKRIEKEKIDLHSLNRYLNKIIEANKSKNFFDDKYLKLFMAKKFLVVVYFKIMNKDLSFLGAIFYKFFWSAPYVILSNKNL
jgi:glycosyltransferase involved in cell wall biosynthesis